ncbi:TetR/AcrR family transcriptional regulator [Leifsonia sp. F6_8S_P_1B]|uniref:TetR/AcrR family transcriptional regulator n=1 Tax=Leifsonia williamsii TaxID=3035919 RepID=A0ABT8KGP0_9MICO|nr:TetR/AcrR family transcriptional regulator [Leifsonia williamsii]MDN4616347.1 TetR/AcrR family transcriptional regulator [Leifsonia williamsii]
MTSVIDGSRFARAAATRQAIVAAAAELFSTRGYRFVSLREIAERAGISHPALLKHFADKEELLAEVAKRFDRSLHGSPSGDGGLPFAAEAARQAGVAGFVPFFAALTGEASTPSHPLHEWMRDRLAASIASRAHDLGAAAGRAVDAERDTARESVRLTAAWAGLRMLARYLGDGVDIVSTLERHQELIAHPAGWSPRPDTPPPAAAAAVPALPPLLDDEPPAPPAGYRTGRARRAKIVADATTLFAREGYGDTSLLDIATRVGVSKSALYHHFASKDALLHAVLRERDHRIDVTTADAPTATAADVLRSFADGAAANERDQPGLIELYAVISSEATVPEHAANAYFEHRFTRALDGFTRLFRSAADAGDLPPHRDPAQEALWLLALWDGLQYLWLYDRHGVDVAAELRAHLEDVLPA